MESQKSLKEDWFLWVLMGAALILVGGYYLVMPTGTPESSSPTWLFEGSRPSTINKISKYTEEDLRYRLVRSEDGNSWEFEQPSDVEVDQAAAEQFVETILNPTIDRRFKANPEVDYGFESNNVRIKITQNGKEHMLYLGEKPPTGRGVYLRYGTAEDAPIFLLGQDEKGNFGRSLYDLRNKRLFDGNLEDVNRLTLSTDGDRVIYSRNESEWDIVEPSKETLNDTQASNFEGDLRTVMMVTAQTFYSEAEPDTYPPVRVRAVFEYGNNDTTTMNIGGKSGEERIVKINNRVAGVTQDPLVTFKDLPFKPDGWPEVEKPAPSPQPAGKSKLKGDFKKKIQRMRSSN